MAAVRSVFRWVLGWMSAPDIIGSVSATVVAANSATAAVTTPEDVAATVVATGSVSATIQVTD